MGDSEKIKKAITMAMEYGSFDGGHLRANKMCECDCYPEHCTDGKHDRCWCGPDEVGMDNGDKVIIHKGEQ